jgi:arylsulfatase A-like enzyme
LLLKPPRSWEITPGVVQTVVSTRDILPTTLSLIGLPVPEKVLGRDLSPLIRGEGQDHERIVISTHPDEPMRNYSAIRGPWKLEVSLDEDDLVLGRELFRLDREGGESEDVSAEFPEIVAELSEALKIRWEEEAGWDLEVRERQLDPLTEERLRSLGYVD